MKFKSPIFVLSHHGGLPLPFTSYAKAGRLSYFWEWDLKSEHIRETSGLLFTMHLDQTLAMSWKSDIDFMLNRGGRILINGHIVCSYIEELVPFIPCKNGKNQLFLTSIGEHPIFYSIDRLAMESRRGVFGFYGRGHNPPPDGASTLTGLGPDHFPVDWVWKRNAGGYVFSHAGNDFWTSTDDIETIKRLAKNIVNWLTI